VVRWRPGWPEKGDADGAADLHGWCLTSADPTPVVLAAEPGGAQADGRGEDQAEAPGRGPIAGRGPRRGKLLVTVMRVSPGPCRRRWRACPAAGVRRGTDAGQQATFRAEHPSR